MSTKKTQDTKSSNALTFDPKSKALYDKLIGSSGDLLQSWMNNPFGNPLYKLGLGQSQRGAQAAGQQGMGALMNNMKISGITGRAGNAFQQAQVNKMGRTNLGLMSGANVGNVMNALQRQQQATAMGMSFQPLLTGETANSHSQEQTSGLGTWLPQLVGAGLQGAMGMATGGASTIASKGMSAASGSGGNPFASFNPSFPGFPQNPFMRPTQ
jgi:hypothetical protein